MSFCIRAPTALRPRCLAALRPSVSAGRLLARSSIATGRTFAGVSSASSAAKEDKANNERLSISFGGEEPPLYKGTIPQHFADVVKRYGDRPAVVSRAPVASPDVTHIAPPRETVYTYAALDRASDVLAHGLQKEAGVRKGDRVAVSLGNGPQFAALTYALFKLGAVLVPLNPVFTTAQISAALSHLGVEVLIIGAVTDLAFKPTRGRSNRPLLEELAGESLKAKENGRIVSESVPSLRQIVLVDNTHDHPAIMGAGDFAHMEERLPGLTPFETLTGGRDILRPQAHFRTGETFDKVALSPDETVNIQFTSGTTSLPKAAMLSHTSILNNGMLIASRMEMQPRDRIVCPPPLFHCFGCILGYMATATTGASLMLPSPAFDPVASLQMAADHRATGLYGVATMYVAMLEHLESGVELHPSHQHHSQPILSPEQVAALPTHLHTGIAAGSSVPESLMRRLYKTLGLNDLVICYGMTETAPVSCMTSPHDSFLQRTSTVGKVMPHTGAKIVDPNDHTRILPRGTPGELATSGYLLMRGYYGDEAQTEDVIRTDEEGIRWMHTGDEATMDEDGYVAVTGRIKDLIIRGGENIHPLEVENCLFEHPLIAEVSVVGVPDERYGEEVGAFVVPNGGVRTEGGITVKPPPMQMEEDNKVLSDEDVREFVRSRMSSHLVPKHVFWIAEYPVTASGKIQKYLLRDMAKKATATSPKEEK